MPIDRRLAEWVFGFRKHMSWSQRDLGAAIGVHRVTVARWESASTYPPSLVRIRLNEIARGEGYDAVPRKYGR